VFNTHGNNNDDDDNNNNNNNAVYYSAFKFKNNYKILCKSVSLK
jgi:hypothetical protein